MSGSALVLAEFVLAFLFHSVALIRILIILLTSSVRKGAIGFFFMTLLINWLLATTLFLPYEIHALVNWRRDQNTVHDGRVLFFIAMPAHIALAAIPVSVFFLTVERICIIQFGPNYGPRVKNVLKSVYFGILAIGTVFNLVGYMLARPNVPYETECEIFGCILRQWVQFYLGWRAFCAFFNFSAGCLFFVLFFRTSRRLMATTNSSLTNAGQDNMRRVHRANNILTSIAILSEFLLAFLPHFGPFIWEQINGEGSSMGTGPLSEVMSSVEVLLFASIYSRVLSAKDQKESVVGTSPPGDIHINHIKERRNSDRVGGPIEHRRHSLKP